MNEKEEILELKAQNSELQKKVNALVNILAKEGVISRRDFEDEFSNLINDSEEK